MLLVSVMPALLLAVAFSTSTAAEVGLDDKFLIHREFQSWKSYYAWRDTRSGWQRINPCVPESKAAYKCLPSLIIIGAFKGGTTGVRFKLLASKQFFGPIGEHHWFGESEKSVTVPRHEEAAKYALTVPRDVMIGNKFVTFEDNPRYIDELNTNELKFIKKVNPDALMLLLARPGADIYFSALEMNAAPSKDCSPFRSFGHNCTTGMARATADAHKIFREGALRAAAMERDWESRDVISFSERAGQYVAKGAYFYALRHLWHTWPREQTLVLESLDLWTRPRENYDALAHALRLNFTIKLVPNTRTRPLRQDKPKCPLVKVEAMKRLISECDLKMPYRCAWYSANNLLAGLLNASWPLSWNNGVSLSTCELHGFTAADMRARFVDDSSKPAKALAREMVPLSGHYRRADIALAADIHKRVSPSEAIGQWLRADPFNDWLTTGHTSEHIACLDRERQGNCHENDGKGSGSRRSFIDRRGSNLKNSPGIMEAREDYAWRVNTSSATTVRMYGGWSGPRSALIKWLELILGSDGRVVVLGDSLSRQFSETLKCTFQYKLNMTGRVLYIAWNYGGKIRYVPKPSDVLVLNFGHHLDHGEGDKLHVIQKKQWAIAFNDLEDKKVEPNRVFVRTTQIRFILKDSPGEWDTSKGMWCGGAAPNASSSFCASAARVRRACPTHPLHLFLRLPFFFCNVLFVFFLACLLLFYCRL